MKREIETETKPLDEATAAEVAESTSRTWCWTVGVRNRVILTRERDVALGYRDRTVFITHAGRISEAEEDWGQDQIHIVQAVGYERAEKVAPRKRRVEVTV